MTSLPTAPDDPLDFIELSRERLLCVVFPKTKSPYYLHAIDVARQATEYREMAGVAGMVHACAFWRSSGGAARAVQLLKWVKGWAGLQVFTAGRLNHDLDEIIYTLDCYQKGLAHKDARANCICISDDALSPPRVSGAPFVIGIGVSDGPPRKRLTIPCRRVVYGFRVEPDHPASWIDQFQAATVQHSTDWCPLLDLSAFRQFD